MRLFGAVVSAITLSVALWILFKGDDGQTSERSSEVGIPRVTQVCAASDEDCREVTPGVEQNVIFLEGSRGASDPGPTENRPGEGLPGDSGGAGQRVAGADGTEGSARSPSVTVYTFEDSGDSSESSDVNPEVGGAIGGRIGGGSDGSSSLAGHSGSSAGTGRGPENSDSRGSSDPSAGTGRGPERTDSGDGGLGLAGDYERSSSETRSAAGVSSTTTQSQSGSGSISNDGVSGSFSNSREQTNSVDLGGDVSGQRTTTTDQSGSVSITSSVEADFSSSRENTDSVQVGVVGASRTQGQSQAGSGSVSGSGAEGEVSQDRYQTETVNVGGTEVSRTQYDSRSGSAGVSSDGASVAGSRTQGAGGCVDGQCVTGSRTISAGQDLNVDSEGVELVRQAEASYDGCVGSSCGQLLVAPSQMVSVGANGVQVTRRATATAGFGGVDAGLDSQQTLGINSNGSLSLSSELEVSVGPIQVPTPKISAGISGSGFNVGDTTFNYQTIANTAVGVVTQPDRQMIQAANAMRSIMNPQSIGSALDNAGGFLNDIVGGLSDFGRSVTGAFGGDEDRGPVNIGQIASAPPVTGRRAWLTMWQNRRNDHNDYAGTRGGSVGGVSGSDCADFCPAISDTSRFVVVNRTFLEGSSSPTFGHVDDGNRQCCYPRFQESLAWAVDSENSYHGLGGTNWYRGYDLTGDPIGARCVDNLGDCCRHCQSDSNCVATRYDENSHSCPMGGPARSQSGGRMIVGEGGDKARRKGYCQWFRRVDHMSPRGNPSDSHFFVSFPVVKEPSLQNISRLRGVPQWPTVDLPIRDTLWCPVGPRLAPNVLRSVRDDFCHYEGVHASGQVLRNSSAYWRSEPAIQSCREQANCAGVIETFAEHFAGAMYFPNGRWVRTVQADDVVTLLKFPGQDYPVVDFSGGIVRLRTSSSVVAWQSPSFDMAEYPPPYSAVMSDTGELAVFSQSPALDSLANLDGLSAAWRSGTASEEGAQHGLVMTEQGQLCIWRMANSKFRRVWCANNDVPRIRVYRLLASSGINYGYSRGHRYWGKKLPRQVATLGGAVDWNHYATNWHDFASCPNNKVAVGMCSSGESQDCHSPARNQRETNVVGCADVAYEDGSRPRIPGVWASSQTQDFPGAGGSTSGTAEGNRWHFDHAEQILKCPSDMIMTGFCGSGANRNCNGGRHQYQIRCRRFDTRYYQLTNCRTTDTIEWADRLEGRSWEDRVYEVMTGICVSGRDHNCQIGNAPRAAKIARFCTLSLK